jgi:hypothetical protein
VIFFGYEKSEPPGEFFEQLILEARVGASWGAMLPALVSRVGKKPDKFSILQKSKEKSYENH